MWWTAAKHELCPRCRYADSLLRLDEVLHELEMAVSGAKPLFPVIP